jgi:hypothetical protein
MGFDDLFENHEKHRSHGGYGSHSQHRDDYDYSGRHKDYSHHKHQLSFYLINKIWTNPKLRIVFLILAIILLLIIILLVIALLPLVYKLVDYILQNGVQGIYNSVMGFIEKLWKGAGK